MAALRRLLFVNESVLFLGMPIIFDHNDAAEADKTALRSNLMGIINTHDFQNRAKGIA
ncbi:hypothetical protein [Paenibacillus pedocola]|uniref:hypothetical protein n=1 Tax=Paenibacillus pedocola TaxID=3242193 RepID=UPI00287791B4|nr:hypothetical protein [Paenibacillus typhae]